MTIAALEKIRDIYSLRIIAACIAALGWHLEAATINTSATCSTISVERAVSGTASGFSACGVAADGTPAPQSYLSNAVSFATAIAEAGNGIGYKVETYGGVSLPFVAQDSSALAAADASLGSIRISRCAPYDSGQYINAQGFGFTFGVPFTVHLHLDSSISAFGAILDYGLDSAGANSSARFDGLQIQLADGQYVNDASVGLISVPEPASWVLVPVAVLLLAKRLSAPHSISPVESQTPDSQT